MLTTNTKKIIALASAAAVVAASCGGVMIYKNNSENVAANEIDSEIAQVQDIASAYHSLTSGKNETVYVISSADGERTTYVSSWLHNPDGSSELSDISDLRDIEVVRGNAVLSEDTDGQITWDASGEDVYYRGVSDDELPVDVNVTYKLDGVELSGSDLEGKSGHLVIKINYQNNLSEQVQTDEGSYTIYMPFVMTTGMLLDNARFTNVEVTNGQVVNDGERTYVMGVGFPGLYDSLGLGSVDIDDPEIEESINEISIPDEITIECDVNDCSKLTELTVASVLDLNELDVSLNTESIDEDMSEMTAGMRSLVDGSERLYSGVSALNDGAVTLNNGASSVAEGAAALASGASDLSNGTNQLAQGALALQNGIGQVNDGAAALNSGISQVQSNIPSLQSGVSDLTNGASELSSGAAALSSGVDTLYGSMTSEEAGQRISALIAGSAEFRTSLETLNSSLSNGVSPEQAEAIQSAISYLTAYAAQTDDENAAQSINALITAYTTMTDQFSQVSAAVSALNEGYSSIDEGINALSGSFTEVANAVASIRTGAASVASGASRVSGGLNTLNSSTGALVDGINTLASGSSALSNGTNALVSGAQDISNGVSQVNDGAAALASSSAALSDGANQLASGTTDLAEGVTALLSGAENLEEGLNEFNDEAVDKLTDMINEVSPVSDHLDALRDYSSEYSTFSGTPAGVEDSVVFVFKS